MLLAVPAVLASALVLGLWIGSRRQQRGLTSNVEMLAGAAASAEPPQVSLERLDSLPDVPTTGESGFPGLDGNEALVNLSAPKSTPPAILQKLEIAVRTAMGDPAVMRRLEEIDVQPVFVGARETQKWLEEDVRKFSTIIREAGLVVEQ